MKNKLSVGDKVKLTQDYAPYYSGYAGNPHVLIKEGTEGIVGAINVPYVFPTKDRSRGHYFVCVDFKVDGVYSGNPKFKQNIWRCGVHPKHIKKA